MVSAVPPKPSSEDFFLPELCTGPVVLVVVLIAELTAFILTIARHVPGEGESLWLDLARISLFLQWIALTSSGLLCTVRPYLMRMSLQGAILLCYGLLLSVTWPGTPAGEPLRFRTAQPHHLRHRQRAGAALLLRAAPMAQQRAARGR